MTGAVASWPCLGCGKELPATERQLVTSSGALCMKCVDAAEEPGPGAIPEPLSGVCPECGGELREWRAGVWQCIGWGSDVARGCGFQTGGAA